MAQKKIQPGVAYTAMGEKKIGGSASATPAAKPAKNLMSSRNTFYDTNKYGSVQKSSTSMGSKDMRKIK